MDPESSSRRANLGLTPKPERTESLPEPNEHVSVLSSVMKDRRSAISFHPGLNGGIGRVVSENLGRQLVTVVHQFENASQAVASTFPDVGPRRSSHCRSTGRDAPGVASGTTPSATFPKFTARQTRLGSVRVLVHGFEAAPRSLAIPPGSPPSDRRSPIEPLHPLEMIADRPRPGVVWFQMGSPIETNLSEATNPVKKRRVEFVRMMAATWHHTRLVAKRSGTATWANSWMTLRHPAPGARNSGVGLVARFEQNGTRSP